MLFRSRIAKSIVFFCLCALQLQVWASVSLPCLHASSDPGVGVTVCPMHGAGESIAAIESPSSLYDCQRCVIALCLGVLHDARLSSVLSVFPGRVPPEAVPPDHFYSFIPENLFRPPIDIG